VTLKNDDGLADLAGTLSTAEEGTDLVVAFVDPPWTQKADWTSIPEIIARAYSRSRRSWIALWYPVKSLTRPNAMLEQLAKAGVGGSMVELITTPLEHQRNRLNGSAMLMLRAPDSIISSLASTAPVLGARCATQGGRWSFRAQAWHGR
jgi:23S rRNA (adenine2030-N6)-methyltransferase